MAATRILLVEDDPHALQGFAAFLKGCGYVVLEASNGRAALAMASTALPDVIVLDLGLPDIDGWEVARQIKADQHTAGIPIIALTGADLPHEVVSSMRAGCDRHLAKPCEAAELVRTIELVAQPSRGD